MSGNEILDMGFVRRATRSSLACLACRSRHLKCDGQKPQCGRCTETDKECQYTQSRRGGLDRAALEARRKRLANTVTSSSHTRHRPSSRHSSPDCQPFLLEERHQQSYNSNGNLSNDYPACGREPEQFFLNTESEPALSSGHDEGDRINNTPATSSSHSQVEDIEQDSLVTLYFKNFHRFHPFILPQKYLARYYRDPKWTPRLAALIAVIRLIGKLYGTKKLSSSLKHDLDALLLEASPDDPFAVQCRLLYSIVLFWSSYKTESQRERDTMVRLAISIGMYKKQFATDHGEGDPVLAESWRRTWWMVYTVDAYYAGTLGTMNMAALEVEATVDLPCEESEYETGSIPEPKTLQDFDNREFDSEGIMFSSFAYLIGAIRCAGRAILSAPRAAPVDDTSLQLIQVADSMIEAWLLLLPPSRASAMNNNGEIDELMFQAHLLIHVAIIGLHRPLSDLKFNSIEGISSCAREPPAEPPSTNLINVHTARVLRSVEAQVRILALPVRPFNHTPFTTCMVSEGTLALLSACAFRLTGKELATARDQIRMIIGCLKALGQLWSRAATNVQEIQKIARHVLSLDNKPAEEARNSGAASIHDSSIGSSTVLSSPNGSEHQQQHQIGKDSADAYNEVLPTGGENIDTLLRCWFNNEDGSVPDFSGWMANDL